MIKAVCGIYQVFTDKEKAELARRAAEHRITSTICYTLPRLRGQKVKTNNVVFLPVLYMDEKLSIF